MNGEGSSASESRERRIAFFLLALTTVAYLVFNVVFLPRLTNQNFGDVEFSGWSGPMGARLLRGERPYVDFVLPIPPGSFVLLAAIQKIVGSFVLLSELWLDAILQLGMALLGYFMAARITTRKNAVLVAITTLITVIELNKECAYDHTAEIVAWGSVACGVAALFPRARTNTDRAWFFAGALAAFTLAFKQSTGVGILVGWAAAFLYLVLVEHFSNDGAIVSYRRPARSFARGATIGVFAVWLVLVLLGSTAGAFVQATFLDASKLKGGPDLLIRNVVAYLTADPAYPASLGLVVLVTWVGHSIGKRNATLHIGDEPSRKQPFRRREVALIAVATVAGFGGGALWLVKGPPGYAPNFIPLFDLFKQIPLFGPATIAILFVVHLLPEGTSNALSATSPEARRAGHSLNAIFLAAFLCTLLHNTSAPEFRPTYDNNPIVPLGFLTIFIILDRGNLRFLRGAVLVLMFASLLGNKYFRAMTATTRVGSSGYLAHMRVNDRGLAVVRAAAHIRKLAAPDETVLVLPEDLEIESTIGRPRPPLVGSIVFVDQYAPRLVKDDIARFDAHLPKVIVIHPRRAIEWQGFFRIWSGSSGAERFIWHVIDDVLPKHYRRESSYPTIFLWQPNTLDVYVRDDNAANDANEDDPTEN